MIRSWYRAAADHLHGPRYLRTRRVIDRLEALDLKAGFRGHRRRVLVLYDPNAIALSQVHPFLGWHGINGAADLDIELKAAQLPAQLERGLDALPDADTIVFQPDLVNIGKAAPRVSHLLRDRFPQARLAMLDGTPHSGLAWAGECADAIDAYVKKSSLIDRADYGRTIIGDTAMTDYFAPRFGCDLPTSSTIVPNRFWDKLIVGPAFPTDKRLMALFARPYDQVRGGDRPIDLNARIATKGLPWYSEMRTEADDHAARLTGIASVRGRGLDMKAFMAELGRSKCTFSPFGYGELCWRDYEAMAMGSVVIKPDMSIFATTPDLFERDRTYVPVAWDLSDFEERTRAILADGPARAAIAEEAYARTRRYLFDGGLGQYLREVMIGNDKPAVVQPEAEAVML